MKQRGMALLTVLLLLAIVVTLVTVVTERWFFSFHYSLHLHQRLQGKWYVTAAENIAAMVLQRDAFDDARHTHLAQQWATEGPHFSLPNAELDVRLTDARTCFNINALPHDEEIQRIFIRLLQLLQIESSQAERLNAAIADWIDGGVKIRAGGAKDDVYQASDPPYLTASQPLWHPSELRPVRGITPEILQQLRPLICVLPEKNFILNLNTLQTAQWPLLAALLPDSSQNEILRWLKQRPAAGWETLEETFTGLEALAGQRHYLTLNSDYFALHVIAQMADTDYRQYSLLQRKNGKVTVLWRYPEMEE
ncbi:type II secretion system minor pseudopilin GspK [Mixta intestinalis]|jgi:general secretion pathway protein K|uniref:Type II secretion system protein K n=1 Tax=Mixta intestinalis TaxID=1615494 RepID=A0A6P1PWQ9_9GAMM|nr:type II secretion system minor pseudopilin GspK [Mixta intestinalis]QHM70218.1 Putative type II secretion system protein K [Mixta intestinalis]